MINRGSDWRKWDLHVHTKGTNKNDQFKSCSIEDFFYYFFKKAFDNKISAIGITDYFSIERYLEAIEYQKNIEGKLNEYGDAIFSGDEVKFIKNIYLFPNVELRMLPTTNKSKLINIHCLFNPEYISNLEHDFFSRIKNESSYQMTRHGIISYGKSLDPSIQNEGEQYKKGVDNFTVDIKSLNETISGNLKNNTILVVSNSSSDGASGTQGHYELFENEPGSLDGVRRSIYNLSDAIFSSNPKDIKYFLGRKSQGNENYSEKIYRSEVEEIKRDKGSLKPCIVGCDAHTEDELFTRFTWIKADLNFEGLRQICLEPESRVKIHPTNPDFKEGKFIIEKVRFISPSNIFSDRQIYLNPNLNVIIGGKSSGKSILLFAIAKTLSSDLSILKNKNDNYLYELDEIEKGLDFEVTTKGGFSQKINLREDNGENSIIPEIKYIPQNYLVKLAEPEVNKTGAPLNKLIRNLIIENNDANRLYADFISNVTQNDKFRNNLIDLYFKISKGIKISEDELKSKSNKEVLTGNIEANTKKIEELNKSIKLTQEQIDSFKLLQNKLEVNKNNINGVNEDYFYVKNANSELLQMLGNLKFRKDSLLSSLKSPKIIEYYKDIYSIVDMLLVKINEVENSLQLETKDDGVSYFKLDCKFNEILSFLNAENKEITNSIQPYLSDRDVGKDIEKLNESITNDKRLLADIDILMKKIKEDKEKLEETKNRIIEVYESSYQEYIKVIEGLKTRTNELEKDGLTIVGKAKFNFQKMKKSLLNVSDGRKSSYKGYSILLDDIESTSEVDYQKIIDDIKRLFDDITSGKYYFNRNANIENVIKDVLDDYFFDYWEITYKNDKLGEMSTGKASFVILMLIVGLSTSKAPILIDQPEDNLDNRSITTDLVGYLRNKKLERQIIVVTHNANIVVNADAENVIVANQIGQNNDRDSSSFRFDYINGAIENSFDKINHEKDILKSMGIRQHIADIVEGGKEAFKMRERKYRFN